MNPNVRCSITSSHLAAYTDKNTVDLNKRWLIENIVEDDQNLFINLQESKDGSGWRWSPNLNTPNRACLQFPLDALSKGNKLVKFNASPAKIEGKTLIVKKSDMREFHKRQFLGRSDPKPRTRHEQITPVSVADIKAAKEIINKAKKEYGAELVLSVDDESGELRILWNM